MLLTYFFHLDFLWLHLLLLQWFLGLLYKYVYIVAIKKNWLCNLAILNFDGWLFVMLSKFRIFDTPFSLYNYSYNNLILSIICCHFFGIRIGSFNDSFIFVGTIDLVGSSRIPFEAAFVIFYTIFFHLAHLLFLLFFGSLFLKQFWVHLLLTSCTVKNFCPYLLFRFLPLFFVNDKCP